ncbi:hypothetical protein D3C75_798630 [compost metagenome]
MRTVTRIVIDLDGTICELRQVDQTYADVLPKQGVSEVINKLFQSGYYIIIHTARHMKTCNNDVVMVRERIEKITIEWLNQYNIPYHEIVFGKPYGDLYIDDLAFRFDSWYTIEKSLL